MSKKTLEVCLSPELIGLHLVSNKAVVVVDIFRATSCMVTGLAHGINSITPVATLEECKDLQTLGYIAGAERDAKKVEGFDLDNSPFSYMSEHLKGKNIAVTTTNGTYAISKVKDTAKVVIAGAFLNLNAVAEKIIDLNLDLIILCAGWKNKPCLEDSLFAGALAHNLRNNFTFADDSTTMCQRMYAEAQADTLSYVQEASHLKRLANLGIEKDISFCMKESVYTEVPVLKNNRLVLD